MISLETPHKAMKRKEFLQYRPLKKDIVKFISLDEERNLKSGFVMQDDFCMTDPLMELLRGDICYFTSPALSSALTISGIRIRSAIIAGAVPTK